MKFKELGKRTYTEQDKANFWSLGLVVALIVVLGLLSISQTGGVL